MTTSIPTLDELTQRAWEATSRLHLERPGPGGRMVTDQPALVAAMVSFALAEMNTVVDVITERLAAQRGA